MVWLRICFSLPSSFRMRILLVFLLVLLLGSSSVRALRVPFSSAFTELDGGLERQEWIPGTQAPLFQLPTSDGIWHYSQGFGSDVVFVNLNTASGISDCMSSSNASIDALLQSALQPETDSFHVVFAANNAGSLGMVNAVAALLHHRLRHLRLHHQWSGRLHFVSRPLSSIYTTTDFIPSLLAQWHTPYRFVRYSLASGAPSPFLPQSGKRLDAQYDWLPSPASIGVGPHTLLPSGVIYTCDDIDANLDLAGKVVLLQDRVSNASYAARLRSCSARGAIAVLIAAGESSALQQIGCVGDECDEELSIAAATIPWQDATLLRYQMQSESVEVQFYSEDGDAFFFAIDSHGKLREVGWTKLPSYQHIVWAMQWHAYERRLHQRLQQSDALVVKVMEEEPLHWSSSAVVTLPTMDFDSVELEFRLSCPGAFDRDCGIWDRIVHVFVCCEDGFGCDRACPPTALPGNQTCGNELGRWITPFRRRIGHWLTDVTALAPLLSSQTCTFSARTTYASAPWSVSLNLRLHKQQRQMKPNKLLDLFRGGSFDYKYNERQIVQLHIPNNIVRASLVMVISGHGSDENNCAEFCVSSHRFVFNGMEGDAVVNELRDAGSPLGCANRVLDGVEPNQHGTWLYGRGGWCDGLPVEPWTRDVSSLLTMGASNQVQYEGLFDGRPPNPQRSPGYIVLYSYLALYDDAREHEFVQLI